MIDWSAKNFCRRRRYLTKNLECQFVIEGGKKNYFPGGRLEQPYAPSIG